jgi:hypothetical protein
MIFHDVEQNSEDWNLLRLGKITSSLVSDLFMKPDTKGYQNAIIKVAYERVTGECEESYSNKWMQRGHEKEFIACENYELFTFNQTENGGFYEYDEWNGSSPDRKIVGLNGGCEFKCPSFQVYHEYLETGKIPKSYYWQIQHQIFCTEWDFVDYMPFSSPKLKQILIRVERNEAIINQLKEQLEISINDIKQLIERIKQ